MTQMTPTAPQGWRVVGRLRDTEHPELLNVAMVELSYPSSDILIYAGWEPEEDAAGHYFIGVLQGCDILGDEATASDMESAARMLFLLAEKHQPNTIVSSDLRFRDQDTDIVVGGSGWFPTIPFQVGYRTSDRSRLVYS